MKYEFPQNIRSSFEGYNVFIDFYNKTDDIFFDEIILDLKNTNWIEANLSAILGAILNKIENELNDVKIINPSDKIEKLLERNHFLSNFGGYKIPDIYETTIKYRKFKTTEEKLFKEYLDRELLSKEAMPEMSTLLRKKINESIFEIFNNAIIHGNCKNIFSCGQYYRTKKRLDFTIVDLGRTIKSNVKDYVNQDISGKDAIKWAIAEGNTTKLGEIPGGLGLSLIREFLGKNNGKIQIVSEDGYWEQKGCIEREECFSQIFPGTIVNLEFNIDDKSYYYLLSEINEDEIF
jgi:hypothetical protein